MTDTAVLEIALQAILIAAKLCARSRITVAATSPGLASRILLQVAAALSNAIAANS